MSHVIKEAPAMTPTEEEGRFRLNLPRKGHVRLKDGADYVVLRNGEPVEAEFYVNEDDVVEVKFKTVAKPVVFIHAELCWDVDEEAEEETK